MADERDREVRVLTEERDNLVLERDALAELLTAAVEAGERLTREHDLAVAHDRRPYETICGLAADFKAERDEARTTIERVRQLHRPDGHTPFCFGCRLEYPCETSFIVAGLLGPVAPAGDEPNAADQP